jgi:tRNA threonylcarbamoyladenosine biosynthesis protein TsaE
MSSQYLELSLSSIQQVAAEFLRVCSPQRKFAFYGAMGSGKTTFITALCKELKAMDLVSSPTFSIVNEYETETGELIYHFDFYRIKTIEELFDIGFEEYCNDIAWCFIEWPEKAEEVISDEFVKVVITIDKSGNRGLSFTI